MKVFQISYYHEFQCLAQQCPDCCCRGWRIPLSDEDEKRYRAEKGWLWFRLRAATHGDEALRFFNDRCVRCPFLTGKGLCYLQKQKGHEYLPETCRLYPRSVIRHLDHTEYHLDLSCVHAAALFIRNRCAQELVETEVPAGSGEEPETYGNNEDADYLQELLSCRAQILDLLRGADSVNALNDVLNRLSVFTETVQSRTLLSGKSVLRTERIPGDVAGKRALFPLPIGVLNDFLSTEFYESSLRKRAPFLYRLCRMYFRRFDRLDYRQGQALLDEMLKRCEEEGAGEATFCADYFISLILRHFSECFEDYSMYLHFEDALIAVNLVLLFRLLYRDRYGDLSDQTQAGILSCVEKRFFHNEKVRKLLKTSLTDGAKQGYI